MLLLLSLRALLLLLSQGLLKLSLLSVQFLSLGLQRMHMFVNLLKTVFDAQHIGLEGVV